MKRTITASLAAIALLVAAWALIYAKGKRVPDVQTAFPASTPYPIPEIINPFETPEERAEKANRQQFVIVDESGKPWAMLSRDDHRNVTKGLTPALTNLYSGTAEPIATREADGWHTRFKSPIIPSPPPLSTKSAKRYDGTGSACATVRTGIWIRKKREQR